MTDQVADLSQGFPKIQAVLVNSDGTIHPVWLRFFLTLWNRTGFGPGVSSEDAFLLAMAQAEAQVGMDTGHSASIDSLMMGTAQPGAVDPLEAVLFDVASGTSTPSPPVPTTMPLYAPMVTGELPGPVLLADPAGACIMVPVDCVSNEC